MSRSGLNRGLVRLALAAATLALAACATAPTFYGPAASPGAVGWSDYRIEPDRFRVTFQGGPGASLQQVADYALLRAADLTLAQGYDWFRVADRQVQGEPSKGPRVGVGMGTGNYGRHSGVSVGLGTSFDLGGGAAVAQTLEIVMGHGPAPREPDVYDAREVRRNLGDKAGVSA
ncbi:hypothetical protein [Phenylobacterium sp.]|uniref:CC0125/CC1285 family lipoprotein n=1 Tax=Phenylobacterium sp. TaxID=1871053 RepID=UPI0035B442D8